MSILSVKTYLKKFNLDQEILEFKTSSATVLDAARTIGCTEGEIAKTMSFLINDKPILIVMAGDVKIDNHKYKEQFQNKAKMIPYEQVEKIIGHAPGGVCPFGINDNIDIYLDESLKIHKYIYPACGSSNSAIKLTPEKLNDILPNSKWIDVTKTCE